MDGSWTIAELAELAAATLAAGRPPGHGTASLNGRVRDVPNERLIRWYTTVGLVDPPLSRRGRTAHYGPRHLLQLVAIKRRQAEGRSLAEIQAELAGATNASLAAVARVPDAVLPPAADVVAGPARAARSSRAPGRRALAGRPAHTAGGSPGIPARAAGKIPAAPRFWARRPGPDPAGASALPRDEPAGGGQDRPGLVYGIRLAPGVTVLLDGAEREPGPEDRAAISVAAGPLLQALATGGLLPQRPSTPKAPGDPPDDPHSQERNHR